MARSNVTAQAASMVGSELLWEAANVDGNMFAHNGRQVLLVQNGGASDVTVTLVTPGTVAGLDIEDPTTTIAAGETYIFGHLNLAAFNQPGPTDAGRVYVNYDQVDSVNVAVLEL